MNEQNVLVLTFKTAYDPFASEIEQSLKESGIEYRESPVPVVHYGGQGEDVHFLYRFVIPLKNIPAVVAWLCSKGYQVFGKNITFDNPGLGKGQTRNIDEMKQLIEALTKSQNDILINEAKVRIAEQAAALRLEQKRSETSARILTDESISSDEHIGE